MESVIAVNPKDGFKLELKFNTGEMRIFDASPYLEKGVFIRDFPLALNPNGSH